MGYDDRKKFWFGTEAYSKWMVTPVSGASVGPTAWNEGGNYLSGGGFQQNSRGSHREHVFEWSESSSYEAAQEMMDFYNGTYGDGLIHFVLPTIYDKNILPSQWASPSTLEGPTSLVPGVEPSVTRSDMVNTATSGSSFPRVMVSYEVPSMGVGEPDKSLFLPIPEGYDLVLGFVGGSGANSGVFVTPVQTGGASESPVRIRPLANEITGRPIREFPVVTDVISGTGRRGVRLWIGRTTAGAVGFVQIYALCARLVPSGSMVSIPDLTVPFSEYPALARKPWVGGMGNSGCRFEAPPTMILNTGINGGTSSYAASFREVGTWLR